jgi:hypothetical protein
MGLVWWLMRVLGPCLVVNGGVGPCLVVNGVWAVFFIWVVSQLTTVNGSVELGFLPPQPHESTPKPLPPQIQSPDLTKLSPLLPPSLSAAAFPCCHRRLGALPCSLCGSDFPRCCCCASLQPPPPPPSRAAAAAAGAILLKASPHHSLHGRPGCCSDAIDAPPMPWSNI